MRIFVIAWIFLVACSHSPDNSGQSLHQFNNTKINVGALSRKEARSIIDEDAVRLKRNFGSLLVQLADKRKRRDQVFDEVIKAYPECQAQRHCISNLVISNKSDFEKYTALMQKLHQVDMEVAAAENIVKEREDQHKLLVRFTMNRNLVRELVTLATTDAQSKIEIYVHSLESFPSWDRISTKQRILPFHVLERLSMSRHCCLPSIFVFTWLISLGADFFSPLYWIRGPAATILRIFVPWKIFAIIY